MPDFLDALARDAKATIKAGYYEHLTEAVTEPVSLSSAIQRSQHAPVIAEIKGASPSAGVIKRDFSAGKVASAMAKGGAVGISVLTEPKHFNGSLANLVKVRVAVELPVLMKDIIVSPRQLEAAARTGANAVLLIQALFDRGCGELGVHEMIEAAHSRKLDVLLEAHDEEEFQRALASDADLVGINNRNLATLDVDLNVTRRILEKKPEDNVIVVSESGIRSAADILFLRKCGANAFLVGSAIMSAANVEEKVREFVFALG
ncbi:MAG TPA: indole-3-glycerol-phosphate synthase [Candidatus Bathyarchaeia archaeon]|nr:indole-3-glycerol-phosphate synthase [Candidatus Bathyarchaeia archaeon]